jgi:hypothetical protein
MIRNPTEIGSVEFPLRKAGHGRWQVVHMYGLIEHMLNETIAVEYYAECLSHLLFVMASTIYSLLHLSS